MTFLAGVLPFAVGTSFTPGPNNLMLAAAGARFGFVRTWRHQLGIVVGFAVMMASVGIGLSALVAVVPTLQTAMKIASVGYVLLLAWKVGSAGEARDDGAIGAPMGFLSAAGFQWINPKAWIITLTATATYTSPLLDSPPSDRVARPRLRDYRRRQHLHLGRVRAADPTLSHVGEEADGVQLVDGGAPRRFDRSGAVRVIGHSHRGLGSEAVRDPADGVPLAPIRSCETVEEM